VRTEATGPYFTAGTFKGVKGVVDAWMDVPGGADEVMTATVRCVYEGGALIAEPDANLGAW
jgi:hypothetical protein